MNDETSPRLAFEYDCQEMAVLCVDIRRDSVPTIHSVGAVEQWIREILVARRSSYVIEQEGEIVGWIDVHIGWVNALYCRRGFTGQGLGLRLLQLAKALSPNGLKLYTFQMNLGARKFYEREEFVEIALGDGSDNEEKTPDVLLEWSPSA